jgi:hypothetical protein
MAECVRWGIAIEGVLACFSVLIQGIALAQQLRLLADAEVQCQKATIEIGTV